MLNQVFQPGFVQGGQFFLLTQPFQLCLQVRIIQLEQQGACGYYIAFFYMHLYHLSGQLAHNAHFLVSYQRAGDLQIVAERAVLYNMSVCRYTCSSGGSHRRFLFIGFTGAGLEYDDEQGRQQQQVCTGL